MKAEDRYRNLKTKENYHKLLEKMSKEEQLDQFAKARERVDSNV
jgi:hypothetical protein